MKKKIILLSLPFLCACSWWAYGEYLSATMPQVELVEVSSLTIQGEKPIPFYELMSPLPSLEGVLLPKLEYKKGPPDRFIERISLLVQANSTAPKEQIIYYGRKTESNSLGMHLFSAKGSKEALYLHSALWLSQKGMLPEYAKGNSLFLLRPFLLKLAHSSLRGVERVSIMDQSGIPAFLFEYEKRKERTKSIAIFMRRNSSYKMEFLGEKGFQQIDPQNIFRKSFLTEKRADALNYLAENLSNIHLEKGPVQIREIAWPILLLAANISVDPSSLEAFFHFAGISALLYKNKDPERKDTETLDILRNNVLASEFYARDINPEARQTAEIGRLARALTRNFIQ